MPSKQQSAAGDGRNWPFTLRVTREERRLLMLAARRERTSAAEIMRRGGLQTLFTELARLHD